MADYRYLFHNLTTNALVAEIPLAGVTFEPQALNAAGPFDATVPALDLATFADLDVLDATEPARRVLYVERDGRVVYAGIVWTRRYSSGDGRIAVAGSEPSSILRHRMAQVNATDTYTNVGDRQIFAERVNLAGSPIGLLAAVPAGVGNLRSRTYVAADFVPYAEQVDSLAEEGFEYANTTEAAGPGEVGPRKRLTLADPRRGRPAATSGLVFEYPGNVGTFDYPEDAGALVNFLWAVGRPPESSAGGDWIVSSSTPSRYEAEGFPFLEDVLRPDATSVAELQRKADAERARRDLPAVLPTIDVTPGQWPAVGDYVVGDRCRLYLDDARRFPVPLEAYARILAQRVAVSAAGVERVTLTLLPWPDALT